MKMIKCPACAAQISSQAKTCPNCGQPNSSSKQRILQILLAVITVFVIAYYLPKQSKIGLNNIHHQVATDFENQYNLAQRQGDKIQICVQAGLVAAGYLQANDESNYQRWKSVEKIDCRRAGVPR